MNVDVKFHSFIDRLWYVIGEDHKYTPWAVKHGLSPVTVSGWLNGAALYPKSWDKLVLATGISKEWWLNGQDEPVYVKEDSRGGNKSSESILLSSRQMNWLEEIANHFLELPEDEQQKIWLYSKDIYEKISIKKANKKYQILLDRLGQKN